MRKNMTFLAPLPAEGDSGGLVSIKAKYFDEIVSILESRNLLPKTADLAEAVSKVREHVGSDDGIGVLSRRAKLGLGDTSTAFGFAGDLRGALGLGASATDAAVREAAARVFNIAKLVPGALAQVGLPRRNPGPTGSGLAGDVRKAWGMSLEDSNETLIVVARHLTGIAASVPPIAARLDRHAHLARSFESQGMKVTMRDGLIITAGGKPFSDRRGA